jgi:hypothetical protein
MEISEMIERERFEHYTIKKFSLKKAPVKSKTGGYYDLTYQYQWEAWQAAIESKAEHTDFCNCRPSIIQDCICGIEAKPEPKQTAIDRLREDQAYLGGPYCDAILELHNHVSSLQLQIIEIENAMRGRG